VLAGGFPSVALAHSTISAADSFLIASEADAGCTLVQLQASISAAGQSLLPGCFGILDMTVPSALAMLWYVSVNDTVNPFEV
jgi:hypothetical protein